MDPILTIHPEKDTTFALMLEAERRGYEIHYMTINQLFMEQYQIYGLTTPIRVNDQLTHFVTFLNETPQKTALKKFKIIFMRKDPPVDKFYLMATYLLEIAQQAGCRIVNDPTGLRTANEKLFSARFSAYCPETLVGSDPDLFLAFLKEYRKIVIKPLDSMGGQQVFLLSEGDRNNISLLQTLTHQGREMITAQRYIPEINAGDKRIMMIDGNAYPYALSRIPAPHDFRGNLVAGGKGIGSTLTERDLEICNAVGPTLKAHGLFLVGLDVIGDYLTEINVTSPTCVREIEKAFHVNLCAEIFDKLNIQP